MSEESKLHRELHTLRVEHNAAMGRAMWKYEKQKARADELRKSLDNCTEIHQRERRMRGEATRRSDELEKEKKKLGESLVELYFYDDIKDRKVLVDKLEKAEVKLSKGREQLNNLIIHINNEDLRITKGHLNSILKTMDLKGDDSG